MGEKRIIREATDTTCIIRTNTYGHSVGFILGLVTVAREHFPNLKLNDVEICHYGGQRYKYTFGIQFKPSGPIPDVYKRVPQIEFVL